jgi:hypothetical protein
VIVIQNSFDNARFLKSPDVEDAGDRIPVGFGSSIREFADWKTLPKAT